MCDGRCLSSHFLLTAAEEQTTGDRFLHVFMEDGSPVARLGCGRGLVLNAAAERNIDNGRWVNITVRYVEFHRLSLTHVIADVLEYPGSAIHTRNKAELQIKTDVSTENPKQQVCFI